MSTPEPSIILSDTHGIYIPQMFCQDITLEEAETMKIDASDLAACQDGPDNDWYWEAWDNILNNAEHTDSQGVTWRLHQDGDLWEVPDGYEWPEF